MDNKLTPQLVLLCEAAGYSTLYVKTLDETLWAYDDDMPMKELPGASGQLASSEVGLVLSWLGQAAFDVKFPAPAAKWDYYVTISGVTGMDAFEVKANEPASLEAALTEAILQLKLGETV